MCLAPRGGFSLMEVLTSLFILSIGLLSLMKMQTFLIDLHEETTLIIRGTHFLNDLSLAHFFADNDAPAIENVKKDFPAGLVKQKTSASNLLFTLSWQLPRQSPFDMRFVFLAE